MEKTSRKSTSLATKKESRYGREENPHTKLRNQIIVELCKFPWCRVWAVETGALQVNDSDRWIHYGLPGAFDITGIVFVKRFTLGVRIELEVKTGSGRLSENQINYGKMITRLGGFEKEVRSVDDAIRFAEYVHNY